MGTTAFVPDGESRRDTAIILIGAAREHGLDDRKHVKATAGGFNISEELADLLYDEGMAETEEKPKARKKASKKKASGNRAAKNKPTEQE